jgi:hypothetical protein
MKELTLKELENKKNELKKLVVIIIKIIPV